MLPRVCRPPAYAEPIDFFIYSRAASDAADSEPSPSFTEEHWSYMDPFAARMTARGPTFAADGETWTGSLHIVDLPDADAARAFVAEEPYDREGLFEDHLIRRFENTIGRTMWEFPREPEQPRFLAIAPHRVVDPSAVPPDQLIFHGELLPVDESQPAGAALAIQAPSHEHLTALLGIDPADPTPADIEIHGWEFGGRR